MTTLPLARGAMIAGWGRYPQGITDLSRPERHSSLQSILDGDASLIPRGLGRSYGDAAQNSHGTTVLMSRLDRMLDFDPGTGVLSCEAGVTIEDIVNIFLPRGFAPPVTPGTRFVTVGGCLACDVHGKNHHRSGCFSRHVLDFNLLLADGTERRCSRDEESDLFWATAGGMGLTGFITSLRVRLKPSATEYISVDYQKAPNLGGTLELLRQADDDYEYSVAWIDCLARGGKTGRSVLMRGNDVEESGQEGRGRRPSHPGLSIPFNMPFRLVNRHTVRLFNEFYYWRAPRSAMGRVQPFSAFFYPLDGLRHWNRIYGRAGFVQYQFVVPEREAETALKAVLSSVAEAGQASFLGVLKAMGPREAGQLLSFPRQGYTLAIDLPWQGVRTARFLDALDKFVIDYGGRVYLAKDARLSADSFRAMYPEVEAWRSIKRRFDPDSRIRSDLAIRLGLLG